MTIRKPASSLLLLLLLASCTTTTITNLTPSQLPRNESGLYLFEVAFDSNQRTLREGSIQPYVLVGLESYAMDKTPLLDGRWEAYVPIAATNSPVKYRYKFDYRFNRFGEPGSGSRLSAEYRLDIQEN